MVDDDRVPLRPMTTVMISPAAARAVGNLTLINVPIPRFDPEDEWFD